MHLERAPSGRRYAPPILCGGSHGGEQAEINWSAHGFVYGATGTPLRQAAQPDATSPGTKQPINVEPHSFVKLYE